MHLKLLLKFPLVATLVKYIARISEKEIHQRDGAGM